MGLQSLVITPDRIGKSLGRILPHAMSKHCLGLLGMTDRQKKNSGTKTVYRRYLPNGATTSNPNQFFQNGTGDRSAAYVARHLTQDGVTPMAETLIPQDIEVEQKEFGFAYGFTNRTAEMSEDPIPKIMEEMLGDRIGLVREMTLFGVLKGCTNKFYAGTGTSRATVNGRLTLQLLRKVERSLKANHSNPARKLLRPVPSSGNYATAPTKACYPVFVSSDLSADVRDLPNFIDVSKYGNPALAVENEIGSCEEFRFIWSPDLIPVQDSGAAVAGTVPALYSTSGTNADVYQVVVGTEDAWGHLELDLGKNDISLLPAGQKDKTDILGQRGYVGAITKYNAVRLNEGQMAVVEVAANALTD